MSSMVHVTWIEGNKTYGAFLPCFDNQIADPMCRLPPAILKKLAAGLNMKVAKFSPKQKKK